MVLLQSLFRASGIKKKKPLRDGMGREEGGGFGMGTTCIPVADSF